MEANVRVRSQGDEQDEQAGTGTGPRPAVAFGTVQPRPGWPRPRVLEDLDAQERAERKRAKFIAATLSFAFAAGAGVAGTAAGVLVAHGDRGVPPTLVAAALLGIAAIVSPLGVLALHHARAAERLARNQDCRDMRDALAHVPDGTVRRLTYLGYRQLRQHVSVTQQQVRVSCAVSLACAAVTVAVLVVGRAAVLTADDTAALATVGALTAAGAALTTVLALAYLRSWRAAAQRVGASYTQAEVYGYLLHAERLAEQVQGGMPAEETAEVRRQLVTAALDTAQRAQNHLLDGPPR